MKKLPMLTLAAGLVLFVALLFILGASLDWWKLDSRSFAFSDALRSTALADDGASTLEVEAPSGKAAWISDGIILNATSASELNAKLSASRLTPGNKSYFKLQMATLCSSVGKDAELPPTVGNFCDGSTEDWEEALARFQSLGPDDEVSAAYEYTALLFESQSNQDRSAILSELEERMLRADAGAEALVAAEALEQAGFASERFARVPADMGLKLSTQDLASAQALAARMVHCERFGGCGPNQLITMQSCYARGGCSSTVTAYDVWRNAHPPHVLRVAWKIKGMMLP